MFYMKKIIDSRLIGRTTENVFLSILNQRGIFSVSFDTNALDGIVYDLDNKYFRVGKPPFYTQIKCRGSPSLKYNPQGHSPETIQKIKSFAGSLNIPESSLYFVVGFFKNNDIRTLIFFGIPFTSLPMFLNTSQYRFSVSLCREVMEVDSNVFSL